MGSGSAIRLAAGLLLALLSLNVLALTFVSSYSLGLGPLNLAARGMFKPILYLNAGFLLAILLRTLGAMGPDDADRTGWTGGRWFALWALVTAAAACLPALTVNFVERDWALTHISGGIHTLRDVLAVFYRPQADMFHRPLGFISLWLDYAIFGKSLWAYHLQSLGLHLVNGLLLRSVLVRLHVEPLAAEWTPLIWLAAAVNWEPVVWPAARFDLLAAAGLLGGLCAALSYLVAEERPHSRLILVALCFSLGLLSKETAYGLVVLMAFFALTPNLWGLPRPSRTRLALLGVTLGVVAVASLIVRFSLYGELGGYRDPTGQPLYSLANCKWMAYLFTRMPLVLLGINTSAAPNRLLTAIVALHAAGLIACVWTFRGWKDRRHLGLLVCAFISALPAAAVIGWIGPSTMHGRHLYIPSMWLIVVVGCAVARCRWRTTVLGLLLAANVLGMWHNLAVQRDAMKTAENAAGAVVAEVAGRPEGEMVSLVGVPAYLHGAVVFSLEVVQRVRLGAPGKRVELAAGIPGDGIAFCWKDDPGTLVRCGEALVPLSPQP
jgi:hypothetical protein